MKPTILFLLASIIFLSPSFSQRYYLQFDKEESAELLDKAERAYVNKSYARSAKLYDKIMAIEGESPELIFNKLTSLVHTKDTIEMEISFKKLVNSDWLDCNYLSKNADFASIKYRTVFKLWQSASRTCASQSKTFNETISHPKLRQQLLWLRMHDIKADVSLLHRVKYGLNAEKSVQELKLERKKIYVDNFFTLLEIVESNGWLGNKEVGKDGAEAIWLITQHANHIPSYQEQFLEKMKVSMEEGNFAKKHYAHLYDRIQANRNQPQRYGTLRYKNPESGNWELYQLEEPEKLADYRKEMGLPPVKN